MLVIFKEKWFLTNCHLIQNSKTRRSKEILKWGITLKVAFLSYSPSIRRDCMSFWRQMWVPHFFLFPQKGLNELKMTKLPLQIKYTKCSLMPPIRIPFFTKLRIRRPIKSVGKRLPTTWSISKEKAPFFIKPTFFFILLILHSSTYSY